MGSSEDDLSEIGVPIESKKPKTIELKRYKNVHYVKRMKWFSIMDPSKEGFTAKLLENDLTMEDFKTKYLNNVSTLKSVALNALYYDWYLGKPDLAENFYSILVKKRKKAGLTNGYLITSDYLIRTGRPKLAAAILKKVPCAAYKGIYAAQCFYYKGSLDYILYGNSRNVSLKLASPLIKKAKTLYNYRSR